MDEQPPAPAQLPAAPTPEPPVADGPIREKKKKKKEEERNRGFETMFRVTFQNHIALSQLADHKAAMLLSVNGLIISLMIAFARYTTEHDGWSWSIAPVIVLIGGSFVSLAFAVIAARPRLGGSRITIDDVRENRGNLLFFSQFTTMALPEFQESLTVLKKDPALLYNSLARQLYSMGQALSKKYRLLQASYNAFLIAIVSTIVVLLGTYAVIHLAR